MKNLENLKKGIIQRIYDWGSPFKEHKPIPVPISFARGSDKTYARLTFVLAQLNLYEEIEREIKCC